ncbi:MAG: hypothetical protein FJ095_12490 [Deltaproteobacteria bacterium]|nr:hypothetical protein [Deltaproteobacteria bacterium]
MADDREHGKSTDGVSAPSEGTRDAASEPRLRLVRSTFTRLSSGFRIPQRSGDREFMEISDALQARLANGRLRIVPSEDATPAIGGVIERMRKLAEVADAGHPLTQASAELVGLVAELRAEVEHIERVRRGESSFGVADGSVMSASFSAVQRLVGAIARARALEGNLAAARSDHESLTQAEEALVLARAQALLEEGVARFTRGSPPRAAPVKSRLRPVFN